MAEHSDLVSIMLSAAYKPFMLGIVMLSVIMVSVVASYLDCHALLIEGPRYFRSALSS